MGTIRKKILLVFMIIICTLELIVSYTVKAAEVKKGNTIGNLNHFGRIVKDGEWLYIGNKLEPNIHKVKIDGSESKDLIVSGNCFGSYYFNIVDGWIYYTKTVSNADLNRSKTYICKQKINGGKEKNFVLDIYLEVQMETEHYMFMIIGFII